MDMARVPMAGKKIKHLSIKRKVLKHMKSSEKQFILDSLVSKARRNNLLSSCPSSESNWQMVRDLFDYPTKGPRLFAFAKLFYPSAETGNKHQTWLTPAAHHWYCRKHPGCILELDDDRSDIRSIRLKSDHLKGLAFSSGYRTQPAISGI